MPKKKELVNTQNKNDNFNLKDVEKLINKKKAAEVAREERRMNAKKYLNFVDKLETINKMHCFKNEQQITSFKTKYLTSIDGHKINKISIVKSFCDWLYIKFPEYPLNFPGGTDYWTIAYIDANGKLDHQCVCYPSGVKSGIEVSEIYNNVMKELKNNEDKILEALDKAICEKIKSKNNAETNDKKFKKEYKELQKTTPLKFVEKLKVLKELDKELDKDSDRYFCYKNESKKFSLNHENLTFYDAIEDMDDYEEDENDDDDYYDKAGRIFGIDAQYDNAGALDIYLHAIIGGRRKYSEIFIGFIDSTGEIKYKPYSNKSGWVLDTFNFSFNNYDKDNRFKYKTILALRKDLISNNEDICEMLDEIIAKKVKEIKRRIGHISSEEF